ncbi:MAG: metal-dependent transcriptional regulator [Oscillospiraceae bacterium]|nr:metal-dependent transcriptional regulator [Oscillospiraceae bacterium]
MNLRNFRNEARDDYLEAILMITQERGHCRSINIADTLDVTKPSVSVAVGKLVEAGLITMDEDKMIHFTEEGLSLAELTLAKHNYLKSFLIDAGVDSETAEKEACAMEHGISEESFRKIQAHYPVRLI